MQNFDSRHAFGCLLAICFLFLTASSGAQNLGQLDPDFGTDGKAFLALGRGNNTGFSTLVQPDGKIVVYGENTTGNGSESFLLRYLPTGQPDSSFGLAGASVLFGSQYYQQNTGGLALQADGKILGAGARVDSSYYSQAVVHRWTSDGQLDHDFGSNGVAIFNLGVNAYFQDLTITADGKILAVGSFFDTASYKSVVVRLLADGTPDPDFGNNGVVAVAFSTSLNTFFSVLALPDGRVLATGYARLGSPEKAIGIAFRLLANGQPDPSFGMTGLVDFAGIGVASVFYDAALQADGKVLLAGFRGPSPSRDLFLARLLENGSSDPDFGTDGLVATDAGGQADALRAVQLLPDGHIQAAGYYQPGTGTLLQSVLVRYTADGEPDNTFGNSGLVTSAISGGYNALYDLALQADGKTVSTGLVRTANGTDVVLFRQEADGSPDLSFGTTGQVVRDISSGSDFGIDVVTAPDGTIYLASTSYVNEYDAALARYAPDGALQMAQPLPGLLARNEYAHTMARQSDGKLILVSGIADSILVWRLNADGTPDLDFGDSGLFRLALANQQGMGTSINDVLVQPDGKILLGGYFLSNVTFQFAALLIRLNTNGSLDNSWGTDGIVLTHIPDNTQILAIALQPDGNVVACGTSTYGDNDLWIARYLPNGLPDTGFDNSGHAVLENSDSEDIGFDVAVDGSDRIVVASISTQPSSDRSLVTARFLPNGLLDSSFGENGTTSIPLGENLYDFSFLYRHASLALQTDGKILLGSSLNTGGTSDLLLARQLSNGDPDPAFGSNGVVVTDVFGFNDFASGITIQADDKILLSGFGYTGQNFEAILARFLPGLVVSASDLSSNSSTLLIYPNPLAELATLRYENPVAGQVTILLENLQGQQLCTYFSGQQAAGKQSVELAFSRDLPAGAYVCRIRSPKGTAAIRVVKH